MECLEGEKTQVSQHQSYGEKTRVFIMGCGSPFGGFVSPFVDFAFGFASFIFYFLQKSQWLVVIGGFGYGFTIERKER